MTTTKVIARLVEAGHEDLAEQLLQSMPGRAPARIEDGEVKLPMYRGFDDQSSKRAVGGVMPCCQTAKIIAQLVEAGHDDLADQFMDVLSGAWEELPEGWTEESVKKMWKSLTGDNKHKITKCMKAMKGKVDNPGAFCGSLAKKVGYER